jgi:dynein heavy chain 1
VKSSAATDGKVRDEKDGKLAAKKKIAELELSLFSLQQSVEIPEINLMVHPLIQKTIDHVRMFEWKRLLKVPTYRKTSKCR